MIRESDCGCEVHCSEYKTQVKKKTRVEGIRESWSRTTESRIANAESDTGKLLQRQALR